MVSNANKGIWIFLTKVPTAVGWQPIVSRLGLHAVAKTVLTAQSVGEQVGDNWSADYEQVSCF